jgi:hypothetical protein
METDTTTITEHRNLVLAQQGGIVVTTVATCAMALIKIYKVLKEVTPSAEPTES